MKLQIALEQQRGKQARIQSLLKKAGIPPRFEHACFQSYQPVGKKARQCWEVCQHYAEKWPERLKWGSGLVMCGKPGTGKNHLAVAIAKVVIQAHQASVLLTKALHIMRAYKNT